MEAFPQIGQIGGIAVDEQTGNVYVFHRAKRQWTALFVFLKFFHCSLYSVSVTDHSIRQNAMRRKVVVQSLRLQLQFSHQLEHCWDRQDRTCKWENL